ncbi:general substrate transporter [Xylariaceae sp. FL0255]|nr:general substrate transporter [Xylariaceae sp. FL0255]
MASTNLDIISVECRFGANQAICSGSLLLIKPGGIMFILLFFVINTPRALIAKGQREHGLKGLSKLRNLSPEHPFVQQEYMENCAQVDAEQEGAQGMNYWLVLKNIVIVRSKTMRSFLAATLFLFHKFTGTDSFNYFSPEICEQIGVTGGSLSLLTTGVYGIVKFLTTALYVSVVVDRIGRRRPLLFCSAIQATCLLYLALYVRFAPHATPMTDIRTLAGGIVGIIVIYIYAFE